MEEEEDRRPTNRGERTPTEQRGELESGMWSAGMILYGGNDEEVTGEREGGRGWERISEWEWERE